MPCIILEHYLTHLNTVTYTFEFSVSRGSICNLKRTPGEWLSGNHSETLQTQSHVRRYLAESDAWETGFVDLPRGRARHPPLCCIHSTPALTI